MKTLEQITFDRLIHSYATREGEINRQKDRLQTTILGTIELMAAHGGATRNQLDILWEIYKRLS